MNVTKVERSDRNGIWLNPKYYNNGSLAATNLRYLYDIMIKVQRSSPNGRVEL